MKSISAFKNIFVVFAFVLSCGWANVAAEDEVIEFPTLLFTNHQFATTYTPYEFVPECNGGPVTRFSISPPLQIEGLSFDTLTGAIRGTPLEAAPYFTDYEITTEGPGGICITSVYLYVYEGLSIRYSQPTHYTINVPIDTLRPTVKGLPAAGWIIYPDLTEATGLTFSSETGEITGTPTKLADSTSYIVQGYSVDDLTGSTEIWISVREAPVVNTPPEITMQPHDTTVVTGMAVELSVAATGIGILSYQWKKGGVDVVGAKSATYALPLVTTSDTGSYSVVVTSTLNGTTTTATSSSAKLSVNATPSITTQPVDQTVVSGSSASFSVQATGQGVLSYQWKKGGADVTGATSAVFLMPYVSITDTGSYSVVVASTLNGTTTTTTSLSAKLSVNTAPLVSMQPRDTTVVSGSPASFTVQGAGVGVLSYQWKKGGVAVAGATFATHALPSVSTSDTGTYSVVVTSTLNGTTTMTTSTSAKLSVNVAPTISTQPHDTTVVAGSSASFSVQASGSGTLSYQWKKGGVNISVANSATYALSSVTPSDTGSYSVIVVSTLNGTKSTTTSSSAHLSVNSVPVITTQPVDQTVIAGSPVSLSVQAAGHGVMDYQWQKGGVSISGAKSATYALPSATTSDTGSYSVVVTSTLNGTMTTTTSVSAKLSVNAAPVISIIPHDTTVVAGSPAMFLVQAAGPGVLSYQWKKGGVNIPGAITASFSLSSTSITDTGAYSVTITSTLNGTIMTTTVATAKLFINTAPSIDTQPNDTTVVSGSAASLSVKASGIGVLSYQWKKGGANIAGAITATYALPLVTTSDTGTYSVVVTSTLNGTNITTTSSSAKLSVNTAPVITTQPVDRTVVAGSTASFSVQATGFGDLSYQWRRNSVDIPGATVTTMSRTAASIADTGDYSVIITSTLNGTKVKTISAAGFLHVNAAPIVSAQPLSSQAIVFGGTATITVAVSPEGGSSEGILSYQWQKDGVPLNLGETVSGVTSSSLVFTELKSSDSGSYSVIITRTLNGTTTTTTSSLARLTSPVAILPNAYVIRVNGKESLYSFQIPKGRAAEWIRLSIIDVYGRTIWSKSMVPSQLESTVLSWNGRTVGGRLASAGVYVFRMSMHEEDGVRNSTRRTITLAPP